MNMLNSFQNEFWLTHTQPEVFRHRQTLDWLNQIASPVVDIGCGSGLLLKHMTEKGIESWGVDVSSVAVDTCRANGLEAEIADFGDGQIPDKPFRTAILLDVLEHLFEPQKILQSIHDRGCEQLIISVPNFCSLPARIQVLRGSVPENNTPKKGHVYWFTLKTLRRLLQETGWEVDQLVINTIWETRPVLGTLTAVLAKITPSLFGLSFMVLARRRVEVSR